MAAPETIVQLVDGGEEEEAQPPHLDDNIMSMILSMLPSESAQRFAVVSKPSGALLKQPAFLEHHLSSRRPLVHLEPPRHGRYPAQGPPAARRLRPPHRRQHRRRPDQPRRAPPPRPSRVPAPHRRACAGRVTSGGRARHVPHADDPQARRLFHRLRWPHMLLARNPTGSYFVCNPAANRWIAFPPPPAGDTVAAGFRCDIVDPASGNTSFTAVLVNPDHVATFSSKTGEWETEEHGAHDDVMAAFSAWGPGIRAGNSIYWLSAAGGRVLCFDDDVGRGGRVSEFGEPPLAEGATKRVGRSLGSAGGRLRLCAFDVRDNEPAGNVVQPHAVQRVHGVFTLDDGDAGTWRRVREVVVRDDISVSFFGVPHGAEVPVDFAGTDGSSIIVNKNQVLFRRDLEGGDKVTLLDLNKQYGRMARVYNNLDVFPLFQ